MVGGGLVSVSFNLSVTHYTPYDGQVRSPRMFPFTGASEYFINRGIK